MILPRTKRRALGVWKPHKCWASGTGAREGLWSDEMGVLGGGDWRGKAC